MNHWWLYISRLSLSHYDEGLSFVAPSILLCGRFSDSLVAILLRCFSSRCRSRCPVDPRRHLSVWWITRLREQFLCVCDAAFFVRSDILTVTSTGSFENFSGRALSNSFRWIFLCLLWSDSGKKCKCPWFESNVDVWDCYINVHHRAWVFHRIILQPMSVVFLYLLSAGRHSLMSDPYIHLSYSAIWRQLINDY